MKHATQLDHFAANLKQLMRIRKINTRALAEKSGLSYSSLAPIVNGMRDCGITKLLALSNALDYSPDVLLKGLYASQNTHPEKLHDTVTTERPLYFAIFISVIKLTYCQLYRVADGKNVNTILPAPLLGGQSPSDFHTLLANSIDKSARHFEEKIHLKDVALFASIQQFGRARNRNKIQAIGENTYTHFMLESDAITNYRAFLGHEDGICVSENDGNMITYSIDGGDTIHTIQGHGFPISDVAGNYWIGCEAIKHTLNVKESIEPSSVLSDRLLALYNDDICALTEAANTDPKACYIQASTIVKELMHRRMKSYEIIQASAERLLGRIHMIDKELKRTLPIFIAGELAYIYDSFIPEKRLITAAKRHNAILLQYGIDLLNRLIA